MFIDQTNFPFEKIRPQQQEIIDRLRNTRKKYIIINAGTGIGKSPLAIAVILSAGKGYLCSTTKQLEAQYVKDFSNLSFGNCHGKGSYRCTKNGGLTSCDVAPCRTNKGLWAKCKSSKSCPYIEAYSKANRSAIFCTNYDYLFKSQISPRDVLVLDEAHNLENKLTSYAELNIIPSILFDKVFEPGDLTDKQLDYFYNIPTDKLVALMWIDELREILDPKLSEINKALDELLKTPNDIKSLTKIPDLTKKTGIITNILDKVNRVLYLEPDNLIYEFDSDKMRIVPLDVSGIFAERVERYADRFVFMSATIFDKYSYCRSIGIDPEETEFIQLDSPFDSDKSPIYFLGGHDMSYRAIKDNSNLEALATSIKMLCDRHPNEKGLIHAGNFGITEFLYEKFKKDKRFLFRRGNIVNEDIIYAHYRSNKPTILVSSSLTEGVSLDGDEGKFQIICKWPWMSLADSRVKQKCANDADWYFENSLQSIVQMAGRTTRSEVDSSVTYVLDKTFILNIRKAKDKGLLPQQFLGRILTQNGKIFA